MNYSVNDIELLLEEAKKEHPDLDINKNKFAHTPGFREMNPTDPEIEISKFFVSWALLKNKKSIYSLNKNNELELTSTNLEKIRNFPPNEPILQAIVEFCKPLQ